MAFAAALLFLWEKKFWHAWGDDRLWHVCISSVVILVREVPRRILRLAVVFAVAGVVFFNGLIQDGLQVASWAWQP